MARTYKDMYRFFARQTAREFDVATSDIDGRFSRHAKRGATNLVRAEARAEETDRDAVGGAFGRVPPVQPWERDLGKKPNLRFWSMEIWEKSQGRSVKVRTWDACTGNALYERIPYSETWSREGLEAMVESAMADFNKTIGVESYHSPLPWNLAKGPWRHMPRTLGGRTAFHERKREEGDKEYVARAARFAGWLRKAAEFPRLVKAMSKIASSKGQNSPYTYVDLWDLAQATRSPGRADRQIAAVRAAANQHLAAYGLRVRWGEVARAVIKHPTRINRAALKAAAATINAQVGHLCGTSFSGRYIDVLKKARGLAEALRAPVAHLAWAVEAVEAFKYVSLREAIPEAAEHLMLDRTDGVDLLIDPDSIIRKDGIYITRGWGVSSARAEVTYLVRGSGRTFHSSRSWGGWQGAMEEALRAWAEQRRLEMKEVDLVSFLRGGSGFIPIVYRRDSYRAGNCQSGTESWVSGRGWGSRQWIPGHLLVPFLADTRVRNVATLLREQLAA